MPGFFQQRADERATSEEAAQRCGCGWRRPMSTSCLVDHRRRDRRNAINVLSFDYRTGHGIQKCYSLPGSGYERQNHLDKLSLCPLQHASPEWGI